VVGPPRPLRHPIERDHVIGELLAVLTPTSTPAEAPIERVDVPS